MNLHILIMWDFFNRYSSYSFHNTPLDIYLHLGYASLKILTGFRIKTMINRKRIHNLYAKYTLRVVSLKTLLRKPSGTKLGQGKKKSSAS